MSNDHRNISHSWPDLELPWLLERERQVPPLTPEDVSASEAAAASNASGCLRGCGFWTLLRLLPQEHRVSQKATAKCKTIDDDSRYARMTVAENGEMGMAS